MSPSAKDTALILQRFMTNEGAAALLVWMLAVEAEVEALAARVTALENP